MRYLRPVTIPDFLSALADHPGARILAGATDVVPQGRKSGQFPETLIDPGVFRREFEGIRMEGGRLWIGAFTPFQEIVDDARLNRDYRLLAEASRWIGSRQIRNMATLGGNIANASPAGDSMPALLVYEAALRCRSRDGVRELPLVQFYLGYKQTALRPGEFIEAVLLPPPPAVRKDYYRKAGPRRVLSISRTALAGLVEERDGTATAYRLAAAGVAPIPVRLRHVEASLRDGLPADRGGERRKSLAAALGEDIAPITDLRGTAEYKFQVTLNFILEMIEEL